ncbi:MAG: FAD-dependent monooxygenase [Bacteroidales bacterium]|jgi:uncharacterized FAD-dependent dehydrogenase|nr:FAD-dependent monooxygenase [Bacteroidales bacterium]
MLHTVSLQVLPAVAHNEFKLKQIVAEKLGTAPRTIHALRIVKRSIDARSRTVKFNVEILCACGDTKQLPQAKLHFEKRNVTHAPEVHIVGAGPAGLFAALQLIERGLKPVIFERGKSVSERKRDVALLNRNEEINPNSNYCFGEGGAGTFSDGKLFTRSKKKGDNRRVLELLVLHGASPDILIDAHPHLGSDRLPDIIVNIRNTILECGGEVHFNTTVEDFEISNNRIQSLLTSLGKIDVHNVILASGHSARDVYYRLHERGVELQAKPCAMGVRAEHPQEFINEVQYHKSDMEFLPAATYSLVHQAQGRGVYSFCMCPGGIIVPSASSAEQTVVNGMSNSQRSSPFANSGVVVELRVEDFADFAVHGVLAALKFQEHLEKLTYLNGGKRQIAPAQRICDFAKGRISGNVPETSYIPGVVNSPLHFWLPPAISTRLQEAFIAFDKKLRGFASFHAEGMIVGVESRTSSPLRIPRNAETLRHERIENLYPCGEGAGYAGGIVSSAIDGMVCALRVES